MPAVEYSSVDFRYRYGSADSDSMDIRYRYDEHVAETSTADLVYRWARDSDTERHPRQYGFWASSTQELGNLFPHWHMARHNPGGNTQQLINAWAMGLDDMKLAYANYRKSLFIDTADLTEPGVFYYAPTVDLRGISRDRTTNLLQNPSFSLVGLARARVPIYWSKRTGESTAAVVPVTTPTQFGTHSISILAAEGEAAYFNQRVVESIRKGTPVTASIWYRCPLDRNVIEADENVAGLHMYVLYADGTMDVVKTPLLLGTDDQWRRASCTITLAKTVASIDFSVVVWNEEETEIQLYLSGAQLEVGPKTTPWTDPLINRVPYLREVSISEPLFDVYADYGEDGRRKLTYLPSFEDMWYGKVPSKVTLTVVTDIPVATQRTNLGWLTTPEGDPPSTTAWRVANNKLEQYNQRITHEVFGSFDIAEFWLDDWYNDMVGVMTEDEDETFSRTIETLCVHQNLLWVVCKESLNGTDYRVLKVLNPRNLCVNPNAYNGGATPMYLECLGDVALSVTSGTADYLGVIDSDSQKMLLRISGTYYEVSFQYDYYTYDDFRGQVIVRTPLVDATLVTV
jgi:hypothetical protein